MNLQRCRLILRPRNPLDCLDLTLVLLRDQARPILRATAILVLPVWAVLSLGAWFTSWHWFWLFLALAAGPFVQMPFTVLGGRLFFSSTAPLSEVLRDLFTCWRGLLAWVFGEMIAVVASLVFCIMPLPFIQALFLFMGETVLLEKVSVQRSIQRSMRLAGRFYGIALFGAFARWVMVIWMALLFEASGQFVTSQLFQMGTPLGSFVAGDVTPYLLLGVLIGHPFFALFRLILYMDVRTRMEGWDLQVALRALALAGANR